MPEDAAGLGHDVGGPDEGAFRVHRVAADEAGGLDVDPPFPLLAHLPEDGEADRVLGDEAVEVRADRAGAVGVGGLEAEGHAGAHVSGRPVRGAVGADGGEGTHEGAVRVRGAGPDVALVEMRVHVDEAGEDHRAGHVDLREAAARDAAVRDGEGGADEAAGLAQKAGGDGHVGERDGPCGQGAEIGHSRLTALSCHLWRRSQLTHDSTR